MIGSLATYLSVPSLDELHDISEVLKDPIPDNAALGTVPSLSSVLHPPETGK